MQNQHSVSRFLLALVLAGLLVFTGGPLGPRISTAQGSNLLQNPGFENTYVPFANDNLRLLAPGWSAWNLARKPGDPNWQNVTPQYQQSTRHVHGGTASQEMFQIFATITGGVFQRVPVSASAGVRFSAFIYLWSTNQDDPNVSEQPGGMSARVGIDPTGGVDPTSTAVVWSSPQTFYDAFRELTVQTTAQSDFITVYIEASAKDGVKHNNAYFDDASLQSGAVVPVGTDTPTATGTLPAATSVPTLTETATQTASPIPPTREGTTTPVETQTDRNTAAAPPTATETQAAAQPNAAVTSQPTQTIPPGFPGKIIYTVAWGDTVIDLANRFHSTVEAIMAANNLDNSALIYVGQVLVIPVPFIPATPSVTPSLGPVTLQPVDTVPLLGPTVLGVGTYIVQQGDDLSHIAARYHISTLALAVLNGILNPSSIRVGQVLVVPGPGNNYPGGGTTPTNTSAPTATAYPSAYPSATTNPQGIRTHIVQPGENLYRIALQYNVSVQTLMQFNGLRNPNVIYVGQVIFIP